MSKRQSPPESQPSTLALTASQLGAWRMEPKASGQQLLVVLHVQPGASQDQWLGWHGDALKLAIKAPPVDGKANHYLIAFLATSFGVRKSDVELRRGELNRHKQFVIKTPTRLPAALAALGLQL
jgi:uncharacterized protein (TIGR00251 family)